METIFDRIEAKIVSQAAENRLMHNDTNHKMNKFVVGQEEVSDQQKIIKQRLENTFNKVTLFTEDIMAQKQVWQEFVKM